MSNSIPPNPEKNLYAGEDALFSRVMQYCSDKASDLGNSTNNAINRIKVVTDPYKKEYLIFFQFSGNYNSVLG